MSRFHQVLIGLAFSVGHVALSVSTICAADNIGVLGTRPRWEILEKYQETITRDDFSRLLQNAYGTHGVPEELISA
jgi:hypothetical protein